MRKPFKIILLILLIPLGLYSVFTTISKWTCTPDLNNYLIEYNKKRISAGAPVLKDIYIFDSLVYSENNYKFRYQNDKELGHVSKTISLIECFDLRNCETDVYRLSNDSSISIRYKHLTENITYKLWFKKINNYTSNPTDTSFEIELIDAKKLIGEQKFQEMMTGK